MLLVDTNIFIDVIGQESRWESWSLWQLKAQCKVHELAINPVIYAELVTGVRVARRRWMIM